MKKTEGADLTEILGVTKREDQISYTNGPSHIAGQFPTHIGDKTDEMRMESNMPALDELHGNRCCATIKLNGTSITIVNIDDIIYACSRNQMFKTDSEDIYTLAANSLDCIKKTLLALGHGAYFQGELCGPGIQQNKMRFKDRRVFLFNSGHTKAGARIRNSLSGGENCVVRALDFVFDKNVHTPEWWYDFMQDKTYQNGTPIEGVVIRPFGGEVETPDTRSISHCMGGAWLSLKVINPKYKMSEK